MHDERVNAVRLRRGAAVREGGRGIAFLRVSAPLGRGWIWDYMPARAGAYEEEGGEEEGAADTE